MQRHQKNNLELLKEYLTKLLPSGHLEIVPVLGTGLHRQFGVTPSNKELIQSLVDWEKLIDAVRGHINLHNLNISKSIPLIMKWELLVGNYAKANNLPTYESEKKLKRIVCRIVEYESKNLNRENYAVFINNKYKDIISLNFDSVLIQPADIPVKESKLSRKKSNISRHFINQSTSRRIWHPHGTIKTPASLCLGLRDYGIIPSEVSKAFSIYKSKESKVLGRAPRNSKQDRIIDYFHDYRNNCINWVELLMISPLVIIGCGLSWQEWGIWWALNQRQRNFSRIEQNNSPPVFYLKSKEKEKANNGNFSIIDIPWIKTVELEDWNSCWKLLIQTI